MPSKSEFHVGQKVLIFKPYGRAEPHEGEVVKVGRTLVHVRNVSFRATATEAYRIESGRYNGDFGGYIRTIEQQAEVERLKGAVAHLKELGYELTSTDYRAIPADLINAVIAAIEQHQQ